MAVVSIGGLSASGASSASMVPSDGSLVVSLSGASVGPIAQEAAGVQDILQQALEEASHNEYPQGTAGTYEGQNTMMATTTDSETIVPCGDPEIGMTCLRIVDPERLVLGENEPVAYTYFTETGEALQTFSNIQPYNYATNASNAYQETESSPNILPDLLGDQSQFVNATEPPQTVSLISEDAITSNLTTENLVNSSVPPKFTFLTTASATTTQFKNNAKKMAPLGSSDNPIRIIQQGNQYKSLQNLTPEQLAQIMQVVQQQQLIRSSQQTGQASILYNPQTQTKIVFKVVYPSELHKNAPLTTTSSMAFNGSQIEGSKNGNLMVGQKKLYHKRKPLNEEKGNSPEFSRQEKELRKKHRQRTRYGRVSRPPQYMVKDYKHIHPVDYDEDYDDSDGGYSDFKEGSSEEDGNSTQKTKNTDHVALGQAGQLGIGKPRKHKCNTCDKGYIGLGGLARHYRLNPTHGSYTETGTDACNSSDSFQSVSTTPCSTQPLVTTFADGIVSASVSVQSSSSSSNGHLMTSSDAVMEMAEVTDAAPVSSGNPLSACEDQEQSNSSPVSKDMADTTDQHSSSSTPMLSHPPKRGKRGRPPSTQQAERRKERLQELVRHCTDEELMEVVMPRLSASVNLWEFLLMKTERKSARPDLSEMIKEFEDFRKQIATMFRTKLVPISTDTSSMAASDEQKMDTDKSLDELENLSADYHVKPKAKTTKSIIEISDSDIAHCLGISSGRYEVKDEEPLRQYKLLTSNPALIHQNPSQTAIRTVELVSQDQLIALPLRKRLRLTENLHGNTASCTLASSSNSAGPEYDWKSLQSCVSVSSNGLCKSEGRNGELSKTAEVLGTSHVSQNETFSADSESVRQPSVNNKLIEFISSSQTIGSCSLSGSSLTTEDPVNSPVIAMMGANHHMVKSEENRHSSPDCKLSFVSANQNCVTLASNNSLPCVNTEPSSQVLHLIGSSTSSSDIMTSACLTVSQFCNGSLSYIDSLSDRRTSSTSAMPANCLSAPNFSSDELQSLFAVKSASENKSCHSVEPSLMETSLFAVNTSADIIAMTNGTLQSTLDHEHVSTVTDSQTSHVLRFISNNVEEPASSGNDFISSPIQDFVGSVDDKLQGQQLLIQDCELGEYTGTHQEIQLDENAQVVQTSDGLIVIRHPDGSIQIHGQPGQQIPFDTVQALFGLDQDNQIMFTDVQQT